MSQGPTAGDADTDNYNRIDKTEKYFDSLAAGCRVGSTILSAEMLVSGGADGSSAVLADRDDLVIGA